MPLGCVQAVTPLNEECGLLEWVPNTNGLRQILMKLYREKGLYTGGKELKAIMPALGATLTWVFDTPKTIKLSGCIIWLLFECFRLLFLFTVRSGRCTGPSCCHGTHLCSVNGSSRASQIPPPGEFIQSNELPWPHLLVSLTNQMSFPDPTSWWVYPIKWASQTPPPGEFIQSNELPRSHLLVSLSNQMSFPDPTPHGEFNQSNELPWPHLLVSLSNQMSFLSTVIH